MNPSVPFAFQHLDPESAASQINQDYEALIAFLTTEVVHRHHLQFNTIDVSGQAAGVGTSYTGNTFPQAFAAGVVPVVLWAPNHTGANPGAIARATASCFNVSNTGFDINVFNNHTAAFGAGSTLKTVAIDPTFDVSQ